MRGEQQRTRSLKQAFIIYDVIAAFWAVFLQTPRVAEDAGVDFRDATRRWLEVIQRVVVKIAAQAANLILLFSRHFNDLTQSGVHKKKEMKSIYLTCVMDIQRNNK